MCYLHTDPNALLVAEIDGHRAKVTNGDHLRRLRAIIVRKNRADEPPKRLEGIQRAGDVIDRRAAKHRVWLQRVSEDRKHEVRMSGKQRKNLNKYVEGRCNKQDRRMKTAIEQIVAQVVGLCKRQGVGTIAYNDKNRDFLPDKFRWAALKTGIRDAFVDGLGGEWVDATECPDGPYTCEDSDKGAEERREWTRRLTAKPKATPVKAAAVTTAWKRVEEDINRTGSHPAVTTTAPRPPKKSTTPSPRSASPRSTTSSRR